MAKSWYPKGKENFANGDIDWINDTIKAVAVDSGYTYSSTHDNLDDVVSGNRIATSPALTSKTSTAGVLDAADATISSVASGDTIAGVIVYKDSGTEATSPLIVFVSEEEDADPISTPTNGSDITLTFGSGGIATL